MSDVIGARCAVSGYEYCCHVHWSVCRYVCVCVWPGPNGETTAHQLLFDYSCRGSGTMSVIRQRYDTHTYCTCTKKTHTSCQSWGRQMKKKSGRHLLIDDVTCRECLRRLPRWFRDWKIISPSVPPLGSL